MKKLLEILGIIVITGSSVSMVIANSPKKEETIQKIEKGKVIIKIQAVMIQIKMIIKIKK